MPKTDALTGTSTSYVTKGHTSESTLFSKYGTGSRSLRLFRRRTGERTKKKIVHVRADEISEAVFVVRITATEVHGLSLLGSLSVADIRAKIILKPSHVKNNLTLYVTIDALMSMDVGNVQIIISFLSYR